MARTAQTRKDPKTGQLVMVRKTSKKSLAARKKPVESTIKKARRYKPGTVALRQIRHYQKDAGTLIPRLSFQRLVREVVQQFAKDTDTRVQRSALAILQEAAEAHVVDVMEDANAIECGVVKRTTLKPDSFRHAARTAQTFSDKCKSLGVGGSWEGQIDNSRASLAKAPVHGSKSVPAEGAKPKGEKEADQEEVEAEEEVSASEEEEIVEE